MKAALKPKKRRRLKRQSGLLAFKESKGVFSVMLVTPRRGSSGWVIPKGNLEPGMGIGASAQKEGFEEAGIEGVRSSQPVGYYFFRKKGSPKMRCRVAVYLLRIRTMHRLWPEWHERRRRFFRLDRALEVLKDARLRRMLKALPERAWRA